jgi:hypothetical protein
MDALRLQVFQTDGAFIADIGLRGDSMTVFLPQIVECHCGDAGVVPIDSLLGVPVLWEPGLSALHAMLWPRRLAGPWTSGTLGHRRGWCSESTGVFIEPDPAALLPRYLVRIDGGDRLTVEARRWTGGSGGAFPAELRLSWPAQETEMWLDLTVRKTEGFGGEVLDPVCPPGVRAYSW